MSDPVTDAAEVWKTHCVDCVHDLHPMNVCSVIVGGSQDGPDYCPCALDYPALAAAYQLARHPDDGHKHSFGCRLCGVDAQPAIDVEALRTAAEDAIAFGHTLAKGNLGHSAYEWRDCPQSLCVRLRAALERSRP